MLDVFYLYDARITDVSKRPLRDLNEFDALTGGFDQLYQLQDALKRAGFRFKPLQDYQNTWAIGFLAERKEAS